MWVKKVEYLIDIISFEENFEKLLKILKFSRGKNITHIVCALFLVERTLVTEQVLLPFNKEYLQYLKN